ncbi:MAG TPA: flagellar basal body rod protein FlgB [Polyangia bacterium]
MKIFDATLGRLERALDVRLVRHNVLAGNLANVDTPGYKPKDVDFNAEMAAASPTGEAGTSATAATAHGHLRTTVGSGIGGAAGDVTIREGAGESALLDGNQVDLDRTMADLATNGMQYGAGARVASKKLAILRYVASDGNG